MAVISSDGITENTVFNRVRITCKCRTNIISGITPYNVDSEGLIIRATGGHTISPNTTDVDELEELRIMRAAIASGTATIYYYDGNTYEWILWSDLPKANWPLHTLHDMLPHADVADLFNALTLESGFERKDDGHPIVRLKGEISTPPYAPTSGTINFHMRAWRGIPVTTHRDRFLISMDIRKERKIVTSEDIRNMPEIRGLVEAMNDIRDSGNLMIAPYDNATPPNYLLASTWTVQTFVIPDADRDVAGADLALTIVGTDTARRLYDGDQCYIRFGIVCETNNVYSYDIKAIDDWLQEFQPTFGTANLMLEGFLGEKDYPGRFSYIEMGDGQGLYFDNGHPFFIAKDDGDSVLHRVYVGHKRVLELGDLTLFSGKYLLPTPLSHPLAEEVHIEDTDEDITIKARIPPLMVREVSNGKPWTIHNSSSHNVIFEDWDDTNIITLSPGEHIDTLFSYRRTGTGRLIGDAPVREMHFNVGDSGVGWAQDRMLIGADAVRPFTTPLAVDYERLDIDAFEVVNDELVLEQSPAPAMDATSLTLTRNGFRMKKAGHLTFRQAVQLDAVSSSGSMSAGWGYYLYRKRGTTIEAVDENTMTAMSSTNTPRQASCFFSGKVEVNDEFYPMMFIIAGNTLSMGSLRVETMVRAAVFHQDITTEWQPPAA